MFFRPAFKNIQNIGAHGSRNFHHWRNYILSEEMITLKLKKKDNSNNCKNLNLRS